MSVRSCQGWAGLRGAGLSFHSTALTAEVRSLIMPQARGKNLDGVGYKAGASPWHVNAEGAVGVAIQLSAKGQAGI